MEFFVTVQFWMYLLSIVLVSFALFTAKNLKERVEQSVILAIQIPFALWAYNLVY